ncbi:MAG: hypothetical protein ACRC8W_13490 [Plesiomonas shigelloides]
MTYGVRGWSSVCDKGSWGIYCNTGSDFTASTLASDHATRIVTREEYEQAVKSTEFEQSVKAVRSTDIAPTPLQRIEQLRKARDEAVRAYNDAFVSGEAELHKLKLGDKIITNSEVARHDGLVLKLVKIAQFGDGRKDRYVCDFVDEKGNNYDIDNLSTVRFAPI